MRAILNVHASRRFRTSALHQVSLLPLLVKTKIMWLLRKTLFQIIVFPKRNGRRISVSWLKSTIPVLNRLLLTRKCVWDVIYVYMLQNPSDAAKVLAEERGFHWSRPYYFSRMGSRYKGLPILPTAFLLFP